MDGRKRRGSAFLLVIALLAGVALGYCFSPGASSAPPPQADKEKAVKRPLADAGEAASLKALRARIAELERQLAERSAEKLPDMVTAVTNAVAEVRAGRGNPLPPDRRNPHLGGGAPSRRAFAARHSAHRDLRKRRFQLDFTLTPPTSATRFYKASVRDEAE